MSQQNRNTKAAKNTPGGLDPRLKVLAFPLLLAVILLVLFAKGFVPGYVHFNNDGPLGEQNTAWQQFPSTMTGSWDDLNDIGSSGGASAPDITELETWILGPVGYSKFYPAIAMFILGMGAWTFFRQLKLSPLAAALGALATALNSSYMGNACWGTAPQQIAMAMVFFALALVMANTDETPRIVRWSRLALAGMAVGVSVMEGADNGAIFSLFVAAFVFFKSLLEEGKPALEKVGRGVGRVAVIAVFAAFIAAQTISALVGTYISGSSGSADGGMSPEEHWDWATEWSLPKRETLGIFVPGVFGYRMDTPNNMAGFLQKSYGNGEYWGGVGRTPAIDRYFDSGGTNWTQGGMMRFGYAGFYGGILVALVALFAILQSFRGENSLFPKLERHFIWFWTVALVISLLLAWGRFAIFYVVIYHLPYFSSIRNPTKFLAIFYLAMIIIFAYGIDALGRRYMQPATEKTSGKPLPFPERFMNWWADFRGFNLYWTFFCAGLFFLSAIGYAIYASKAVPMSDYLQKVGYGDDVAPLIFKFSVGQVAWFLLYLAVAIGLLILVIAGFFSGKRAMLGGLLLGAFVVADLGRADLPWIIHWDYIQKYSSNPIIDILRDKPYEHRVADIPSGMPFEELYRIEWMQHHFPYYNIQCTDIIQSSRTGTDLVAYDMALAATGPDTTYLAARRWALTNTRYFLAPSSMNGYSTLDALNGQFDPVQRPFHVVQEFNVVPKPGYDNPTDPQLWTVVSTNNGDYALIDYTAALPRAKLYSNWLVSTNDTEILKALASPNFNPQNILLVSTPQPGLPDSSKGDNSGTVDFKSYAPKKIVLSAQATAPSILLLNDHFDPNWRVSVDGKSAELLRCNYIMRGVYLTPGSHTVEFQYSQPNPPLYVTLTTMVLGVLLCGFLVSLTRKRPPAASIVEPVQRDKRASAGNRNASPEVRSASH